MHLCIFLLVFITSLSLLKIPYTEFELEKDINRCVNGFYNPKVKHRHVTYIDRCFTLIEWVIGHSYRYYSYIKLMKTRKKILFVVSPFPLQR